MRATDPASRFAVKAGGAIIAASIAVLASAQAQAADRSVRYECAAQGELSVQRSASSARVMFAGRTYDLQRRRSSIGAKYLSANAALIIDRASAIFVADDHLDLGTCVRPASVAAAR